MLKFLVVFHNLPSVKAYTTILFENMLPILRRKMQVNVTWFVYRPERLNLSTQNNPETTILSIHDYENAVEVLQKVRPDMVYALPGYSPIEHAFALASRALHIPLITGELGMPRFHKANTMRLIKLYIHQFFQSSYLADTGESQKRFMKRGRVFLFKYLFLIRTQSALKFNKLKIFGNIIFDLKRTFFPGSKMWKVYTRFECDINFVESKKYVERLVSAGYKRSTLIVTGNPTYDPIFQRLEKFKPVIKKDDKIRVLLITTNPNDPSGSWSKKLRDSWIKEIVTEISKHKNEISLVVKIHPSGEILSEYESLIKPINPTIPVYQKGDIIEFLEAADVVIGTSSSTALTCSLLANKPIIIWNVFNVEGDVFLERGLALECKTISSLIPLIYQSSSLKLPSKEKVEDYINEFLYKSDGLATERICNIILDMIKN